MSGTLFMPANTFANEPEVKQALPADVTPAKEGEVPNSVLVNVGNLADAAQQLTSDRFNRFILQIDGFFGDAQSEAEVNRSWGRVRIDSIKPGDEGWEVKARVKLRVVLPQAERRLRLLVSNEDSDVNGNNARGLDSGNNDQDVALAIRFVRSIKDGLQLKFDVGARIRDEKGQVFGRISAANSGPLGWGWERTISNNFYLYSASGYQNSFNFDVRRTLNSAATVFLRGSTSIDARKGVGGASVTETLGVYAELSKRSALAVEGIFNFITSKDGEFDTRYLGATYRVRFRQNIWRPWFYYELWPSIFYLASNDYTRSYGGQIRMEVLFGQY